MFKYANSKLYIKPPPLACICLSPKFYQIKMNDGETKAESEHKLRDYIESPVLSHQLYHHSTWNDNKITASEALAHIFSSSQIPFTSCAYERL